MKLPPAKLPRSLTAEQFNALKVSNGSLVVKANKYSVSDKSQRTYGGRVFASKAEMTTAQELDVLRNAGKIADWFPQPRFKLHVNGIHVGTYVADFRVVYPDGRVEFWDTKGFEPPLFKLKRKMVEAEYQIKIVVVKR